MNGEFAILHLANLQIRRTLAPEWEGGWHRIIADLCEDINSNLSAEAIAEKFLVVAGDVAYSGDHNSYAAALELLGQLTGGTRIDNEKLLVVPGNHDVDWAMPGGRRLDAFTRFSERFLPSHAVVRRRVRQFPNEGVTFITLDSTASRSSYGRISVRQLSEVTRELQALNVSDDVLVAVLHHGIDSRTSGDHTVRNSAILQRFFDEWGIEIVLHGGGHRVPFWSISESPYGRQLCLGAGALSPEPWRRNWQSPQYNLIVCHKDRTVTVRPRAYVFDAGRWASPEAQPMKLHLADKPPLRPRVAARMPLQKAPSSALLSLMTHRLNTMPLHSLRELVESLGPAIPNYEPEEEPKSVFVRRLIDYFARENSLFVLSEAVNRVMGVEDYARTRIFVSSCRDDRQVAREIASALKEAGHTVWFDEWNIRVGESISERIMEGMTSADMLLVLLSRQSARSPNVALEMGLWIGAPGNKRLVPVLLDETPLPQMLSGLQSIDLRNRQAGHGREVAEKLDELAAQFAMSGRRSLKK